MVGCLVSLQILFGGQLLLAEITGDPTRAVRFQQVSQQLAGGAEGELAGITVGFFEVSLS